jgi:hypothetical protein
VVTLQAKPRLDNTEQRLAKISGLILHLKQLMLRTVDRMNQFSGLERPGCMEKRAGQTDAACTDGGAGVRV